jgi:hypothetical protein
VSAYAPAMESPRITIAHAIRTFDINPSAPGG